jgi:predicted RecB family nuclease
MDDPLLDWLGLFGEQNGFVRDDKLAGYLRELDFGRFVMQKGNEFESAFMLWIEQRAEVRVIGDFRVSRTIEATNDTVDAMAAGVPVISQGVLRNPQNQTYGQPDLLIRLDVLLGLFPDLQKVEDQHRVEDRAPASSDQYRVIDIKFSTLGLLRDGSVNGDHSEYKVQIDIYNRALGRIQGYQPPVAYLAGRAWRQGSSDRGFSAVERLGPVPVFGDAKRGEILQSLTDRAVNWSRRVQTEGSEWGVLPVPAVPELYPNASNSGSAWHDAKSRIAASIGELTRLSYVTPAIRRTAHAAGIASIDDPACTASEIGITGATRPALVDALIDINRSSNTELMSPSQVLAGESVWRRPTGTEFYVDFETVNNLDDDFAQFPIAGGESLIFMIGCGHVENGEWTFRQFTTDRLDTASEERVVDDWIAHMDSISDGGDAVVHHWSAAEGSSFEGQYNNARDRHPERIWPPVNWFDIYRNVFTAEPVVVKGAFGLGLKAIAKAMKSHGLIETDWGDSPVDGMGAMVAAWHCDAMADSQGGRLLDQDIMQEVADYNEVDCRVMWEILDHLRKNH